MVKSIRYIIEDEIGKTEREIKDSLQRYHDATGMIPTAIYFESIDVKTCAADEPRKSILVSNVTLISNA